MPVMGSHDRHGSAEEIAAGSIGAIRQSYLLSTWFFDNRFRFSSFVTFEKQALNSFSRCLTCKESTLLHFEPFIVLFMNDCPQSQIWHQHTRITARFSDQIFGSSPIWHSLFNGQIDLLIVISCRNPEILTEELQRTGISHSMARICGYAARSSFLYPGFPSSTKECTHTPLLCSGMTESILTVLRYNGEGNC
jgi:hypothetical protein